MSWWQRDKTNKDNKDNPTIVLDHSDPKGRNDVRFVICKMQMMFNVVLVFSLSLTHFVPNRDPIKNIDRQINEQIDRLRYVPCLSFHSASADQLGFVSFTVMTECSIPLVWDLYLVGHIHTSGTMMGLRCR